MKDNSLFTDLVIAQADLLLALGALVLLVIGVCLKERAMKRIAIGGITLLFVSGILTMQQDNMGGVVPLFDGMLVYDRFGTFMKVLVAMAGIAGMTMAVRDIGNQVIGRFEYVILILLSVLGMNIMIASDNMLPFYLGLELQSLSLYILAAFNRNSLHSSEAGLKYFILGALSSGILLFGISLIYGYTGTTSFALIADTLAAQGGAVSMAIIIGLVFVLVGVAFKLSAVPFHMWTPDVYQGAPACVTAFFAMAPKIAAIAVLARILFSAFGDLQAEWVQILYALSLGSMILGAFAGLIQKNLYRLLAYSAIGNIGYALTGLITGNVDGLTASLFYIALYFVATAGIFAFMLTLRDKNDLPAAQIADFAGLAKFSPIKGYGLAIMLFSLSGIPPMAGFMAKLFVFKAVISAGYFVLAIVGVTTSVVAAYYYLNVIKVIFFDQASEKPTYTPQCSPLLSFIYWPALILTMTLVAIPDWLLYEAEQAALSLY